MVLANAHRKEGAAPFGLHDIAPWLESSEQRHQREYDEQTQYLTQVYQSTQDSD